VTTLAMAGEVADTCPSPDLRAAVLAVTEAAGGARTWSASGRAVLIGELDRAITVLTSVRADLLIAERDGGGWKHAGDPSFEAWRARTSRSGMGAAFREVRCADALVAMPEMRRAAELGQVSVEHVDVVAKVAATGSAPVRQALATAQGQAEVLGLARRLDAGRFTRSMVLWAATLDSVALERSHQAQRAARFLHLADTQTGTRISGQLDRMAGHRLRLALEAVSGRPAVDDDRSPEQRRADALQTIAEKVLALPETGSGAAVRPHVSFLMSAETWAGLRTSRRGGPPVPPVPPATLEDGTPVPPATLEDGTPVPPSEIARALCDCELTRIVRDAADEPVNLGRTARTYSGAQRRAVIARDRGCVWPSCDLPARWCEVHHIRWWDRDGGETSVRDGALACSFHHHEVHRLDLTITRHVVDPAECLVGTPRVRYTFALPDGTVVAGGPSDGRAGALPDGRAGALPAAVAASIVPVASAGPPEGMASGGPTAGASPPGGQRLGAVRAPDTPTALTGGPPDTAWTRGGEVAPDSRAQAASVQPQLALLGFDRGREACPG